MDHLQTVSDAARTLNLLDGSGKLAPIDSLTVLDLVNEIERVARISIPTNELRPEAFASLETIAELVTRLASKPK